MSFVAQYHGVCALCPAHIYPGEEIAYDVDNEIVHAEHVSHPEKPQVICPKCHMTKPCEDDE